MLTACPKCGAHYALADEAMGRMARCRTCGRKFAALPVEGPGSEGIRSSGWRRRRALAAAVAALVAAGAVLTVLWVTGYTLPPG